MIIRRGKGSYTTTTGLLVVSYGVIKVVLAHLKSV